MFCASVKQISWLILISLFWVIPIGAQQSEVSADANQKVHDEVTALAAQVPAVCQTADRKGCDQLLEKLLTIGEANKLGSDRDFRVAIIFPLSFSPAAIKNPTPYAERALKIFGHDLAPDESTAVPCSLIARGALPLGGQAGLNRLAAIEKQYPYCKEPIDPYRSMLAQAVAAQRSDYSAVEGIDASKQPAASKIASLTRDAEKAFHQGANAEGERLLSQIFRIADENHLGGERNFTIAYSRLIPLAAGKDIDKYIANYERVLKITGIEANPNAITTICTQAYSMSHSKDDKYAEAERRLPECKDQFKELGAAVAKGAAIQAGIQALITKGDCTEAEKQGATEEECQKLREFQMMATNLVQGSKKGDWTSLYPLMKKRWEESQKNGDEDEGATSMALFAMHAGEMADARKLVMQIENDPKNYEGSEETGLLGIKDLRIPDDSRSGAAAYSVGAFYNLKVDPKNAELKRNALQLIFSFKNRDLEEAAKVIGLLKSAHTGRGAEVVSKLVKEYAEISNSWAQASVTCHDIPHDKEEAELERMGALEDQLHKLHLGELKDKAAPRVADVQRALKENDVLVEFAEIFSPPYDPKQKPTFKILANYDLTQFHYVAYVLRHDGAISGFDLGSVQDVDQEVKAYRALITGYSRERELKLREDGRRNELLQSRQAAHKLYERLWRPLLPVLMASKQGHIYISPDANLALLPFDALVDGANRFLLQDYHISYLASGRQLVSLAREEGHGAGVEVFANPSFKEMKTGLSSDQTRGRDESKCLAKYYMPLPNTQIEANDLCKAFDGKCQEFTGDLAKETELKKVNGPRVLHLATHGYYVSAPAPAPEGASSARPDPIKKAKYRFLRSGLVFGDFNVDGNKGEDGIATSLELAFLNLSRTDLVVLSACDSGISDTTPGDNLSGMRSAFHVAGARTVISSLWKLDDEAGVDIMKKFYRYFSGGAGKGYTTSEALRQAKLDLLQEYEDQKVGLHPYYWASFVAEGEDRVVFIPSSVH